MSLREIKDNSVIAGYLSSMLASGRLVHAFLFTGAHGSAYKLGREFAKALLCPEGKGDSCGSCRACVQFDTGNSPDYIEIARSEGRQSIVAPQIEELQERLRFVPEGDRQVALIDEAQLMNSAAQNKLLKTLEEPSPGTVIILVADSRDSLLPTIVSRCSVYSAGEEIPDIPAEYARAASEFAELILGKAPFYRKKECIRPILSVKEEARTASGLFVDALENELGERLKKTAGSGAEELELLTEAIRQCESARRKLRLSYNPAYLLKGMCLKL